VAVACIQAESVRFAIVNTFQWLLALHVTGAFLLLGGTVMAGIFGVLAQRATRPSEVAVFLGLTRFAVPLIIGGALLTLVLGLWLVHHAGFSYTAPWIIVSILLWIFASVAGQRGGERERKTREFALELIASGDAPSPELRVRMRDTVTLALSWGSGLASIAILALMIWKPGA
jgi:uncharacterized membrane protein